jgi:hypothetical protein
MTLISGRCHESSRLPIRSVATTTISVDVLSLSPRRRTTRARRDRVDESTKTKNRVVRNARAPDCPIGSGYGERQIGKSGARARTNLMVR